MFQSARLKLTAWYLLIIMFISIIFSVALYRVIDQEIQRFIHRVEHQQQDRFDILQPHSLPPVTIQELQESEQRLFITLLFINFGILIFSGAAGYFLAGRTLRPIKDMVDEQNRFITDASHELRTPLTALKSEIEVTLRDKQLSLTDTKKLLESNLEEVNNLQILSDNLIQLAQYQKPNGHNVFEKVSLLDTLQNAQKKVQNWAKQKEIVITLQAKDYTINAEKQSLLQCFTIFLDNAIKYSPKESEIKIQTEKTDHSILVHIKDHGIGIAKKDIPHIFDRFYRADTSRSKQYIPGYGLGLSIAKKIIDTHHGTISVTSELGKGTTFSIQLPLS